MNSRFPVLSTISGILRFAGWVVTAGAVLYGLLYQGLILPNQPRYHFDTGNAVAIASAVLGAVIGLITVAFGETIGVLFAIEENTRRAADQRALK